MCLECTHARAVLCCCAVNRLVQVYLSKLQEFDVAVKVPLEMQALQLLALRSPSCTGVLGQMAGD